MSDTLVFDMASASEGAPSVFVRKDWLSILDNMNQNYQGNQCIIDTSQLANSNKYLSYREGYLMIPMLLTLTSTSSAMTGSTNDFQMGLKNWYGTIIHSFSLDYNGTTIVQQTPFVGMWNAFKLMTSLSLNDITTQGASIGFYPDDSSSWTYFGSAIGSGGRGVCNNQNFDTSTVVTGTSQGSVGNSGFLKRQQYWNFDPAAVAGTGATDLYSSLMTVDALKQVWKSYIFQNTTQAQQVGICAQVYLKHLHSFFERVPLLKGVFMKLILNLNQSSVSYTVAAGAGKTLACTSVNSPLGGVSPLMIASAAVSNGSVNAPNAADYIYSIAVGPKCLNSIQTGLAGVQNNPVGGGSVQLIVPAYTFNPVFETSMLSSPIKKVVYEDVYQYTVSKVAAGSAFTYLITNGIANVKSVLVLPYYNSETNYVGAGATVPVPPFQSPFDPAGAGPTSPLCLFSNFNVQVSGQNAIYNTQRYSFEQFSNQLYGQNAVNGGMTDGLTSGLVGLKDFEQEYCYYYVNVSRMLPIEEAVPKAINLIGINQSAKAIDMYVFISYGVEVSIDILSGARV